MSGGNWIYDEVRKSFVKATPEEIVRQSLLHLMIDELGFPYNYLAVEKKLSELPHLQLDGCGIPLRRFDIVCFARGSTSFFPLLMVECKAEAINQKAINQVIGYNHYVKASFVALAGRNEIQLGWFDKSIKRYTFTSQLPPYQKLLESLHESRAS